MKTLEGHYSLSLSPFYLKRIEGDISLGAANEIKRLAKLNSKNPENVYPGYRDGVLLVKLPASVCLLSKNIELLPDDTLTAKYECRVPGEEPRKKLFITLPITSPRISPAKSTFVVLYHKDVLAEDDEHIDTDWAIVAHISSALDVPEPMEPETLIYNHYHYSGGTQTGFTPEEFEEALGISTSFWKNRALLILEEV